MGSPDDRLDIHVNIEVTAKALSTIVANAKAIAGRDEKGGFRVDTADLVGRMVSRFLDRYDFEGFVAEVRNYPELS
jgi:hypothetical protein